MRTTGDLAAQTQGWSGADALELVIMIGGMEFRVERLIGTRSCMYLVAGEPVVRL